MQPTDLGTYVTLTDAQLHPDGTTVAFVVNRMDLEEDRYDRSIWVWDGETARAFSHGPADTRPRWSPNGDRLAFLRASGIPGEGAQVAVMPAAGGEAQVITDFGIKALEAEWAPDGSMLAVVGEVWTEEWRELDADERKRRPRRVDGPRWRFDTLGMLHDRERAVYTVDLDGGEPARITSGPLDSGVVWRPDGGAVAFLSPRHARAGFDSATQAWEVPVGGGEPEALVAPGMWSAVSYRPDGVVHLVGIEDAAAYPATSGLFRLHAGVPERLAPGYDRNLVSPAPTTTPVGPVWLEDGSCRIIAEDRGSLVVLEIDAAGSHREIVGGRRLVTGIACRPDGSAMAMLTTSAADPGELVWVEGDVERTLTDLNAGFRDGAGAVEPEFFTTTTADGTELDVWVFLPPGDAAVPGLLNIHGGPATQYGWGFFDEFQVFVGAGYAVVATNPRGSTGRGEEYVRVPVQRWTEERPPDLEDVLVAMDAAVARFDRIDADRLGVMGGSYGGLMTARVLAVDDRWKSAVAERGLYNFVSFAGTSDIGFVFPARYLGEWEYADWSDLWEASPLRLAHRITTPCLIIHSEADYRCPIEQAEQLFGVLLDQGVPTELLRFPDESHELSRSGKPVHRRERFEAILDWHGRYLAAGE
jgi:dipeptidyl aminopeptidase/acylaminoacyl peptidase